MSRRKVHQIPISDEQVRVEHRRLEAMEEVLREEMARKGLRITRLSRGMGYGPAFLNNALTPGPGERPRIRVESLLRVLTLLDLSPLELFKRIEERISWAEAGESPGKTPVLQGADSSELPTSLRLLLRRVVEVWREADQEAGGASARSPGIMRRSSGRPASARRK